jgi:hypothetical protein
MEKEFILYEQALDLKKLGFDEEGFGRFRKGKFQLNTLGKPHKYNSNPIVPGDVVAPTYSQVFRWFRDNYNLFCEINIDETMEPKFAYTIKEYESTQFFEGFKEDILSEYLYYKYEEAELECLKKLIEIVKNENEIR